MTVADDVIRALDRLDITVYLVTTDGAVEMWKQEN